MQTFPFSGAGSTYPLLFRHCASVSVRPVVSVHEFRDVKQPATSAAITAPAPTSKSRRVRFETKVTPATDPRSTAVAYHSRGRKDEDSRGNDRIAPVTRMSLTVSGESGHKGAIVRTT